MKNPTIYKLQEDNYLTLSKREKQWEMQFFELKKYKEKYVKFKCKRRSHSHSQLPNAFQYLERSQY